MNDEVWAYALGILLSLFLAMFVHLDARAFAQQRIHNKRGPAMFLAFAIGPLVLIPWFVQTRGWRRGWWRGVLAVLSIAVLLLLLPEK